jgi:hypothetical protein
MGRSGSAHRIAGSRDATNAAASSRRRTVGAACRKARLDPANGAVRRMDGGRAPVTVLAGQGRGGTAFWE